MRKILTLNLIFNYYLKLTRDTQLFKVVRYIEMPKAAPKNLFVIFKS